MSIRIIAPTHGEPAVGKAAQTFADLYFQVTGITPKWGDDGHSDLVLIGNDAVNDYLMELMLSGKLGELGIRYGTDDYVVRCVTLEGRRLLLLAGGRGRSTLYAVYHWFEQFADCHYFWDGDVIPAKGSLELTECNVVERPRFEYRGFRYFAHRSLHRFQAEHWGYEDWKKELLFLTKRRLNFFMLRIGMDDLWQRAFPESCDYTVDKSGEGYNDRTPFWDLKYRGELRKRVLAFARELDLIHPEDCGTMSHWYSPAPESFIEKEKPDFFPQADTRYQSRRTLVWDIRKQRNMDLYMKLTETAEKEFNPNPEFFHTIGLGERNMLPDKNQNFRLKKITLRRIAQSLRERYPHTKLLVAGWDFIGWWKGREVGELLRELDPKQTMILDYTAEADDEDQTFLHWDMVGKFPYIFGLFHGYQANSALRGPYERSDARLKVAAEDPMCKGMVVWPELSHSDPLMLEYLANNAWNPLQMTIEQMAEQYSFRRYGAKGAAMNELWQAALPIIKIGDWGGFTNRDESDPLAERYLTTHAVHHEMWSNMCYEFVRNYESPYRTANFTHKNEHGVSNRTHFTYKLRTHKEALATTPAILRQGATIPYGEDAFVDRDLLDVVRTTLGRFINFMLMKIILIADEDLPKATRLKEQALSLLELLGEILNHHEDYSLFASLQRLEKEHPVTPNFEDTLKRNFLCSYCRTYAAEPCRYLFVKEAQVALDWITTPKEQRPATDFAAKREELEAEFFARPLREMQQPSKAPLSELLREAAEIVEKVEL